MPYIIPIALFCSVHLISCHLPQNLLEKLKEHGSDKVESGALLRAVEERCTDLETQLQLSQLQVDEGVMQIEHVSGCNTHSKHLPRSVSARQSIWRAAVVSAMVLDSFTRALSLYSSSRAWPSFLPPFLS